MKKNKLELKKKIVAALSDTQKEKIIGGDDSDTTYSECPDCETLLHATCVTCMQDTCDSCVTCSPVECGEGGGGGVSVYC
jgi:hypothetical protein